ncbi:hypothetical protein QAD02_021049 [Eretmocerus hayati]|uniref:Uncharacterized protein n=1 Tax=Eretmocerus hayati TaxID=131215 RepID=A0ACC2PR14_9HYME|nr:hypothetical protein QAD02_021049 [Eretmocerus hayati]
MSLFNVVTNNDVDEFSHDIRNPPIPDSLQNFEAKSKIMHVVGSHTNISNRASKLKIKDIRSIEGDYLKNIPKPNSRDEAKMIQDNVKSVSGAAPHPAVSHSSKPKLVDYSTSEDGSDDDKELVIVKLLLAGELMYDFMLQRATIPTVGKSMEKLLQNRMLEKDETDEEKEGQREQGYELMNVGIGELKASEKEYDCEKSNFTSENQSTVNSEEERGQKVRISEFDGDFEATGCAGAENENESNRSNMNLDIQHEKKTLKKKRKPDEIQMKSHKMEADRVRESDGCKREKSEAEKRSILRLNRKESSRSCMNLDIEKKQATLKRKLTPEEIQMRLRKIEAERVRDSDRDRKMRDEDARRVPESETAFQIEEKAGELEAVSQIEEEKSEESKKIDERPNNKPKRKYNRRNNKTCTQTTNTLAQEKEETTENSTCQTEYVYVIPPPPAPVAVSCDNVTVDEQLNLALQYIQPEMDSIQPALVNDVSFSAEVIASGDDSGNYSASGEFEISPEVVQLVNDFENSAFNNLSDSDFDMDEFIKKKVPQ